MRINSVNHENEDENEDDNFNSEDFFNKLSQKDFKSKREPFELEQCVVEDAKLRFDGGILVNAAGQRVHTLEGWSTCDCAELVWYPE